MTRIEGMETNEGYQADLIFCFGLNPTRPVRRATDAPARGYSNTVSPAMRLSTTRKLPERDAPCASPFCAKLHPRH